LRAAADTAATGAVATLVGRLTMSFTMSFTIRQPQAVSGSRGVLVVLCALKGG
jgi:hypothetical protein